MTHLERICGVTGTDDNYRHLCRHRTKLKSIDAILVVLAEDRDERFAERTIHCSNHVNLPNPGFDVFADVGTLGNDPELDLHFADVHLVDFGEFALYALYEAFSSPRNEF
jgi:hypothetical protein